eukprot:TRINITY_DN9162_c4_g1_i1.p1 TRINITY_DN9162_c4_g1~~TRINITY_DN9162_c4_g1_i1.p1  ORF type:complete len:989 (-),score=122.07 TRINITY_DN9162_c4_g1_i1:213-3179(-)
MSGRDWARYGDGNQRKSWHQGSGHSLRHGNQWEEHAASEQQQQLQQQQQQQQPHHKLHRQQPVRNSLRRVARDTYASGRSVGSTGGESLSNGASGNCGAAGCSGCGSCGESMGGECGGGCNVAFPTGYACGGGGSGNGQNSGCGHGYMGMRCGGSGSGGGCGVGCGGSGCGRTDGCGGCAGGSIDLGGCGGACAGACLGGYPAAYSGENTYFVERAGGCGNGGAGNFECGAGESGNSGANPPGGSWTECSGDSNAGEGVVSNNYSGQADHRGKRQNTNQTEVLIDKLVTSVEAWDLPGSIKAFVKLANPDKWHAVRSDPRTANVIQSFPLMLQRHGDQVQPQQLVDFAFAIGKVQLSDQTVKGLLFNIAEVAKHRMDSFTPRDISGIVWRFVSLVVRPHDFMSLIAAEIVKKRRDFDPTQLATTAWAFAKCGLWNKHLANAIADECLEKIEVFYAKSLSHMAWAMALWGTRKDDLMNAIAIQVEGKIQDLTMTPLSMIAWSFASLQVQNPRLMAAISKEAQRIRVFKAQDIAHLAWAFAKLSVQDNELFDLLSVEFRHLTTNAQPPVLAKTAWAFSKANVIDQELQAAIAIECVKQITKFKPGEITMLSWAFASTGEQHHQLMAEIGSQAVSKIRYYSPTQLSHIAWAFGALALRHEEFFKAIADLVTKKVALFSSGGLSDITWACAMIMYRDERMLRLAASQISKDIGVLRPLALTRCAWAYKALSVHSFQLLSAISEEAMRKLQDFPTKALVKLVDDSYAKPAPELEEAVLVRTRKIASLMQKAWVNRASLTGTAMQMHGQDFKRLGVRDLGKVGTPLLLHLLNFDVPERSFMRWCFQQPWLDHVLQEQGKDTNDASASANAVTAARYELAFHGKTAKDHVYADSNGVDEEEMSMKSLQLLTWVDALDNSGGGVSMYRVLAELCTITASLDVDLQDEDACSEVTGSVQMLSSFVPCLASLGCLLQFTIIFPNVSVQFCELISEPSD